MNKEEAFQKADELVEQLEGTGWVPHAYQFGIWRVEARNGPLVVTYHQEDDDSWYLSYLRCPQNREALKDSWNSDGWIYDDPNEAVQARLARARSVVEPLWHILSEIEERVPKRSLPIEVDYRAYTMQLSRYSRDILKRDKHEKSPQRKIIMTVVEGSYFEQQSEILTRVIRQGFNIFDKLKEVVSGEPNPEKKRALAANLFGGWLQPCKRAMKAIKVLEERDAPLPTDPEPIKELFVNKCQEAITYIIHNEELKPTLTTKGLKNLLLATNLRRECMLQNTIEIDAGRCCGKPVLPGTRFPAAQVVAQIASGDSVDDIADNFELDKDLIVNFLNALAQAVGNLNFKDPLEAEKGV